MWSLKRALGLTSDWAWAPTGAKTASARVAQREVMRERVASDFMRGSFKVQVSTFSLVSWLRQLWRRR
jgi:hypothetical protein